ncbi:MAG: acetyl-CoA carboxylase biotin carboxylase subunit, partial [Phycisphaerales bacterium]
YMEKYIIDGRHIEFQIMADAFGGVVYLGERECSAQRRHQKLVEESPSPVMDPETRKDLGEKLRVAMRRIGYRNAGTVEFFRDSNGHIYFMEVNARLQVEHPVTEQVTGRDLVTEQLHVAANEALSFDQHEIEMNGHSIECRINAEDPFDDFKPSPGEVTEFAPPQEIAGVKVRVDSHVQPGYRIPVYYDSLIAKLIVWGPDRDAARNGMIKALESFHVGGVKTTIPVHLQIMRDPDFAAGNYDTGFIARLLAEG